MAEYINLEKLIALKNNVEYMCYDLYDLEDFLADVKKECSADVVEVVHGEWIKRGMITRCSVCDKRALHNNHQDLMLSNYCPYCGAKMDGDKK